MDHEEEMYEEMYEDENDYTDWGFNEDEGFDPYMGEYTWDC